MKLRSITQLGAMVLMSLSITVVANAQATRTWVSGVGDDANPCSRTAPCKTFAGAISKTARNGEIDAIDPGGFGAVTITKSITIDGGGTFAAILSSGVNGVIVNITDFVNDPLAVVTLRNLSINGAGTGLDGVKWLSGKKLNIENVEIFGFNGSPGRAIEVQGSASTTMFLSVNHCSIYNNLGTGIAIIPSASPLPTITGDIFNTFIGSEGSASSAASAVFVGNNAKVSIRSSELVDHLFAGAVDTTSTTAASVFIDDCNIARNQKGVTVAGLSTVRLSRTVIQGNSTAGFTIGGSGVISTFGDNRLADNGANVGALTNVPGLQ